MPLGARWCDSTYLGAASFDFGRRIRVDAGGSAVVLSQSGNLVKLNPQASAFVYNKVVDGGNALAMDASGNAFVAGTISSLVQPVTAGALQSCYAGGTSDIILSQFDPAGNLIAGSYYGRAGIDLSVDLAVAAGGSVSILGRTETSVREVSPFVANLKLTYLTESPGLYFTFSPDKSTSRCRSNWP